MKVFDPTAVCCKCGHDKTKVAWCPGLEFSSFTAACRQKAAQKAAQGLYNFADLDKDHMEVECVTCGYIWIARPLDRATPLELLANV